MRFSLRVVGWLCGGSLIAVDAAACRRCRAQRRRSAKRREAAADEAAVDGRRRQAVRIRWRSIPIWRFGRSSCSCVLFAILKQVRLAADCRGARRAGAEDRGQHRRRRRPSTRRPSGCWPSTRRSWPPRPARSGRCSTKPAAMRSTPRAASRPRPQGRRGRAGPRRFARSSGPRMRRSRSWPSPAPTGDRPGPQGRPRAAYATPEQDNSSCATRSASWRRRNPSKN